MLKTPIFTYDSEWEDWLSQTEISENCRLSGEPPIKYPCIGIYFIYDHPNGAYSYQPELMIEFVYPEDIATKYRLSWTVGNGDYCHCHRQTWERTEDFDSREAAESKIKELSTQRNDKKWHYDIEADATLERIVETEKENIKL